MFIAKVLGIVSGISASVIALVASAAAPTSFWVGEHYGATSTTSPATGAWALLDSGYDVVISMITGIFPILLPVIATFVFIFMIWRFIMGKLRMRG